MRYLMPLVLFLIVSVPARADDEKPDGDLGKLQGSWKALVGPEKNFPIVLEIKGKSVVVKVMNQEGREIELKGEFKIDEKASPHRTLDWVNFKRPDGEDAQPNLSIYKIEGETFTVCSGGPGNARPAEFKAGEGGPPNLIEFKRVTK